MFAATILVVSRYISHRMSLPFYLQVDHFLMQSFVNLRIVINKF
jgi:hypothetical protein